jgi:RNA 2',3'-cyclic 3'-phosphodiesterase
MPRLFTGLEIPKSVADRIAFLRGGLIGARWVEPSDYHLTLRFIGDIDDRLADEIAQMLEGVRRRPFKLRLSGLDVFGKDRPHSLVAMVESSRELVELQAEHERLMQRIGIAPEPRRYRPHVTIARLKDTRHREAMDWITIRSPFWTDPFPVGRFVLFSSKTSVGGGPYLVEEAYPLVGRTERSEAHAQSA